MLRDMQREDKIEADHIIGDLIEKAKEKEIATPILEIAYCHLKTYELKNHELKRSSVLSGAPQSSGSA
jgi:2-dehydropantoate 2-reductase